MNLSIVVPAYNEEEYLEATLDSILGSAARLCSRTDAYVEIIVVDNNSSDSPAAIALAKGALVIHEPSQSISRARNTGAHRAAADVLIFIDADVTIPPDLLEEIHAAMRRPSVRRRRG